jgi:hypothetical protein
MFVINTHWRNKKNKQTSMLDYFCVNKVFSAHATTKINLSSLVNSNGRQTLINVDPTPKTEFDPNPDLD